jgi:hypothetical protein
MLRLWWGILAAAEGTVDRTAVPRCRHTLPHRTADRCAVPWLRYRIAIAKLASAVVLHSTVALVAWWMLLQCPRGLFSPSSLEATAIALSSPFVTMHLSLQSSPPFRGLAEPILPCIWNQAYCVAPEDKPDTPIDSKVSSMLYQSQLLNHNERGTLWSASESTSDAEDVTIVP